MSDSAFDLLARPIQHVLWDMKWAALRPIQVEAIHTVLKTSQHALISARTASGKTEAAFLPILSQLHSSPPASIGAMYVGPLKALINDQFGRLEDLCQRTNIAVHKWHGDVGAGKKQAVIHKPSGVLLITPESLESMFVNRSRFLTKLFGDLRFVVIDEIHALIGCERGLQLRSQLFRLQQLMQQLPRLIGLSATIGDAIDHYRMWLSPEAPEKVAFITDPGEKKDVFLGIRTFRRLSKPESTPATEQATDVEEISEPPEMIEYIVKHFGGHKNLIFCRKVDIEVLADELNTACKIAGRSPEFLVHHGSLSREVREETEKDMKGVRPYTTLCSSTLELGIDIGNVYSVGQIGATWSVNSLVQRLGRSGRKDGEAHRLRLLVLAPPDDREGDLIDQLHLPLIRAIAIIELMREKWVEPPTIDNYDLSTLTQQLLSILAETGGIHASELFERLATRGAFRHLAPALFKQVFRALGASGLLEQMQDGTLILTPAAEKLVHSLDFYAAFATDIEFTVRHHGKSIGKIAALQVPPIGEHFLLAGKRWQIESVDPKRFEVIVRPSFGRKAPPLVTDGGEIHERVRLKMREVLMGSFSPNYVDELGLKLLGDARRTASRFRLNDRDIIETRDGEFIWFTWTSSKVQFTLMWLLNLLQIGAVDKKEAFVIRCSLADFEKKAASPALGELTPIELAHSIPFLEQRKFNQYLSRDLCALAMAHDFLDLPAATTKILQSASEIVRLNCRTE